MTEANLQPTQPPAQDTWERLLKQTELFAAQAVTDLLQKRRVNKDENLTEDQIRHIQSEFQHLVCQIVDRLRHRKENSLVCNEPYMLPVSEMNLSNRRKGGHQEWLRRQQQLELNRKLPLAYPETHPSVRNLLQLLKEQLSRREAPKIETGTRSEQIRPRTSHSAFTLTSELGILIPHSALHGAPRTQSNLIASQKIFSNPNDRSNRQQKSKVPGECPRERGSLPNIPRREQDGKMIFLELRPN